MRDNPGHPRGGDGRHGQREDSFDSISQDRVEPLRSVTLGVGESEPRGRSFAGRYEDQQSSESMEMSPSSLWGQRRPMDAPDQPSDPYGAPPPDVPMRRPDGRPGGPGGGYGRADRRPSRRPRTAVVATVVAAVIVLAVTLVLANRRSNLAPDGGARSTGDNSAIAPPPVFTPDDNARVPPGNASGAPPQPAEPTPSGEPEPTKPAPPPGPPPPNPPPARVTLHTLDAKAEADGPSGKRVNSVIGLKRFPQSTSVFVNCSGRSATLTYQLGGDYTRLTTTAGLTGDATPGNLVARMSITGDGRELSAATVSLDRSEALSVDVKGVRTMVVSTRRAAGTCRRDNQPYGVLGNASLLRR